MTAFVPRIQTGAAAHSGTFRSVRICICCGERIEKDPGTSGNPNICDVCNEGCGEINSGERNFERDESNGAGNVNAFSWEQFKAVWLLAAGGRP
jgi:hypothetical protein